LADALFWHRLQFAFTAVYHYIFPQLTMGLAFIIVLMKWRALRSPSSHWNDTARFWIRIFGLNFAVGVVTGVPMEFQFGTNWAAFSNYAGKVIGNTLAMEGLFAFFLESGFIAMLVFGERRLSSRGHFLAALALWIGSWISGYFIVATNAFMQHPVGHMIGPDGTLQVESFRAFVLNPWAFAEYAHAIIAAVVTGSFAVAAVGAFYTPAAKARRICAQLPAPGCGGGLDRFRAGCISDRRPAGQTGGEASACLAGRDGRPLRERTHGRDQPDRPAQRERTPSRQSGARARRLELSRVRNLPQ
jgi:cytochrome d ubiquinol oxidase subunit I